MLKPPFCHTMKYYCITVLKLNTVNWDKRPPRDLTIQEYLFLFNNNDFFLFRLANSFHYDFIEQDFLGIHI